MTLKVPAYEPTAVTLTADDVPHAVRQLDGAMAALQESVTEVADLRARWIAHLASTTSVRDAAEDLGISPAAVSKAIARADASHVDAGRLASRSPGCPAPGASPPNPASTCPTPAITGCWG